MNWLRLKMKPTRTADAKCAPGKDYASAERTHHENNLDTFLAQRESDFETLNKGLDDVEEHLSNEPKTS
jgi:hypothetical protein